MREVMRDGHTEPRVRLADLTLAPATIGVGALEGLLGEVTIVDGEVQIATAPEHVVTNVTAIGTYHATLLSIATPNSSEAATETGRLDESSLARLAARFAPLATVDVTGVVEQLNVHVARGACPHGATTPATQPHLWSAAAGTTVRLVGFYAPDAAGSLTHHGTAFHLHAIAVTAAGDRRSGHVDAFVLRPGAIVRLGRCER
jgi:alpha-acetolactate decarboxylase